MQILKDNINAAILEAATARFMQHGYQGATMRAIAKDVGMSVSNLYRYYADKQSLFTALTGPYYRFYFTRLAAFLDEETEDIYTPENIRSLARRIFNDFRQYRTPFLLLMRCNDAPVLGDYHARQVEVFTRHLVAGSTPGAGFDPTLVEILARGMIDGIYNVVQRTTDPNLLYERLYHLLRFYFGGLSLFHDIP